MKHIAVYTRVSTLEQTTNSQNYAISEWLDNNPQDLPVKTYTDEGVSGAKDDRPGLGAILAACRAGEVHTLVVYKLDRLSRKVSTSLSLILELDELGVEFVAASQPIFTEKKFRYVMIAVFAEIAETERETMLERIHAGIASAKSRGVVFGPPRKITPEIVEDMQVLRDTGLGYKVIAKKMGYSPATVHRYLKAE